VSFEGHFGDLLSVTLRAQLTSDLLAIAKLLVKARMKSAIGLNLGRVSSID